MSRPRARIVDDVLAALDAASADLSALADRAAGLDDANRRIETENDRLRAELADLVAIVKAAKAESHAARRAAEQAEAEAAAHVERAERLRSDLAAATDDLSRIEAATSRLRARR